MAFEFGNKSQLKQIVPLLQKANENDFKNGELGRQISNLGTEIDQSALIEFLKGFPTLTDQEKSSYRGSAQVASQGTKRRLLDELKSFETNQNKTETVTIQDRIKAIKEKYQNWLAHLL